MKKLDEKQLKDVNGGTLAPGLVETKETGYKYKCNSCKNEFLKSNTFSEHPKCPNCKSTNTELVSDN